MNKKLYVDGLRQLKIPGIIGTVLMSVIAFFVAYSGTFLQNPEHMGGMQDWPKVVDFAAYMPMFMISTCVFTIILTMVMFSFLHRRNSSDFYHALPIKRESLYLTYAAAVLSWAMAIVVIPMLIMLAMFALDLNHNLEPARVLWTLVTVVVCTLLVCGASLVGVSATGTGFTNFVVLVIILVVPRAIMTAVVAVITSSVTTVNFGDLPGFFGIHWNALFAVPYEYVRGIDESGVVGLPSVASLIYTTVLAMVYGGWGLLTFKWRNSEVAGMPNFNKFWQGVTRTVPAFCLTAVGTMILAMYYLNGSMPEDSDWFWIMFVYAVAIVVYFLYELITIKKWKALGGAAKTLPILILANVLLYLATMIPVNVLRNDFKDASQVSAVYVRDYGSYDSTQESGWKQAGFIEDHEFVETVVSAYNDTLTLHYHYPNKNDVGLWEIELDNGYRLFRNIAVTFVVNGHQEQRSLYVSPEQYTFMQEKLYGLAREGAVQLEFPSFVPGNSSFYCSQSIVDYTNLTDSQMELIYRIWKREVGTYENYSRFMDEDYVAEFVLYKGKARFIFKISKNTPETMQALIETVNENRQSDWRTIGHLKNLADDNLTVQVYANGTIETLYGAKKDDGSVIPEMIADFETYDNIYQEDFIVLGISWYGFTRNPEQYFDAGKMICLTQDEYAAFCEKYMLKK